VVFDCFHLYVSCEWFLQLRAFRFHARMRESTILAGATKAVSEWFPKGERGLATALFEVVFDRRCNHPTPDFFGFIFGGDGDRPLSCRVCWGFLWLIVWRKMYFLPKDHPRVGTEELHLIGFGDKRSASSCRTASPALGDLLRLPQTWGTIISKTFTDPVWFFITDWFPIYLVAKGIPLKAFRQRGRPSLAVQKSGREPPKEVRDRRN